MTGLLALGDSFTCGEGVGVRVAPELTWTGLLASALPDPSRELLATPGARARDVVADQLPRVREAAVATLLVGLNDVARAGFDAGRVRESILRSVERLCECADTVLLGRLHDPLRLLWVPAPLRGPLRARLAQVNAAIDEGAALPRVHVVDLDAVTALRSRQGWAVDRVHPSHWGHVALAEEAAGVLRRAGHQVYHQNVCPPPSKPSPVERAWWLSRHGIPYAAGNVRGWGITSGRAGYPTSA
jgi:lysophospholipase L1-like esterase